MNIRQSSSTVARASLLAAISILCTCLVSTVSIAQEQNLIIATKHAPPFAMVDSEGEWHGLSISLWKSLAKDLNLAYSFEEATLDEMINGVASGRFDASIAATTINHERELLVDFTHPFYTTCYGVVVRQADTSWWSMVTRLFTPEIFRILGMLIILLLFVGVCFWLAERRKNQSEFRPGIQGLGDGFWFSAVTMTTTGYGDMAPRTWPGRVVGMIWMFSALIITSTFTGIIASSLTADRIGQRIERPSDLGGFSTGSIQGSSSDNWLDSQGLEFAGYSSVDEGLAAVANGEVQSFVYDRPLLQYLVEKSHAGTIDLIPRAFGRQDYGIALPEGSELREPMNRALLDVLASDEWALMMRRWLGAG